MPREQLPKVEDGVVVDYLDEDPEIPTQRYAIISFISPEKVIKQKAEFMNEKFNKYKMDKEFEEEADRCISVVDGFLNRFASEKKLEKLKTDNLLLSAAYLVDKEKISDFKEAFEKLRSSDGDLKYMLSGPWPVYNFITLSHSVDGKLDGPDLIETILQHKDTVKKDGT